jgi:hypothetical protein
MQMKKLYVKEETPKSRDAKKGYYTREFDVK